MNFQYDLEDWKILIMSLGGVFFVALSLAAGVLTGSLMGKQTLAVKIAACKTENERMTAVYMHIGGPIWKEGWPGEKSGNVEGKIV